MSSFNEEHFVPWSACKKDVSQPNKSKAICKICDSKVKYCKDIQPYSTMDHEGFRGLLKVLEACYAMGQHISQVAIRKLYADSKECIRPSLQSAEKVA